MNELLNARRIHLIGIGGSGISAVARLLLERGYQVSGSDRSPSPLAAELAALGARVLYGHSAENVHGVDLVVRSSAVTDDNVEVQAARAAGIAVLKRSEFLGQLMQGNTVIAIAGTHGKTTITAMTAWMLTALGFDPSYLIGGTAKNLAGKNAHAGQGSMFVIEADEYDRMFLGLSPNLAVVSYLEHDHPDCFPTMAAYTNAFREFVRRLQPGGTLLLNHDSHAVVLADALPQDCVLYRYGINAPADYAALELAPNNNGGYRYQAWFRPQTAEARKLADVSLRVPGQHNVSNSLAVLAALHQLEPAADLQRAAEALGAFAGTGRRFDLRGEANGIALIDDYAHHPTAISATLAAARARYPQRRIWAVWQPHTFSRTRQLLAEFSSAFTDADRVLVMEVYAAREQAKDFDNFSAAQVVAQMRHPQARFVPTLPDATALLLQELEPGDVVLVLSAGDADRVSTDVLKALQERK